MNNLISSYMVEDPISVPEDMPLQDIIRLIGDTGKSHIIVNGKYDGTLQGIISKQDILNRLKRIVNETTGKTYTSHLTKSLNASDIMTKNPIVVKPTDTIEYGVELLLQQEFHCLPVVQDDIPIGIITMFDLLKGYYEHYG